VSFKESYPDLTDHELACKLLDELICRLSLAERLDINERMVIAAMEMIAARRAANPDYPITLWLSDRMRERGLVL
jgi:2-keto-4-pentenoate hydratase